MLAPSSHARCSLLLPSPVHHTPLPHTLQRYHHGRRWTDKFNHVVGVMHTNYLDYAKREEQGALKEMLMK
jgi:hypothetical protein